MNNAPLQAPIPALAASLSPSFGIILAGLVALIARVFLHNPRHVAHIIPLCTRLNRAVTRFQRLMARLAAGRRPRLARPRFARPRPSRAGQGGGTEALAPNPAAARLPTTRAWLITAIPYHAAGYASQLNHLLSQPGVPDLLAAAPSAGRILRPLCRMLGITPPAPAPSPPAPATYRPTPAQPRPSAPPSPTSWPTLDSDPIGLLIAGPPPREKPA